MGGAFGDGDVLEDADGAPLLLVGPARKKKLTGKDSGDNKRKAPGAARPSAAATEDVKVDDGPPLSRAERRALKSKQRKLASLEVRS